MSLSFEISLVGIRSMLSKATASVSSVSSRLMPTRSRSKIKIVSMLRPRRRRETNKSLIKETKVLNFKADTVTDVTAVIVDVVIVRSVARFQWKGWRYTEMTITCGILQPIEILWASQQLLLLQKRWLWFVYKISARVICSLNFESYTSSQSWPWRSGSVVEAPLRLVKDVLYNFVRKSYSWWLAKKNR